jgi:hypothetical protein
VGATTTKETTTTKEAAPVPTTPASRVEQAEERVAKTGSEVSSLKAQLRQARELPSRTNAELAQLHQKRKELAPRTFAGDAQAQVELEGIEDRTDELNRYKRVADAAVPELEAMVKEASERLGKARKQLAQARAYEVYDRLKEVESRRDEKAEQLKEILVEHAKVLSEYAAAVREYSDDEANRLVSSPSIGHVQFFRRHFSRWIKV